MIDPTKLAQHWRQVRTVETGVWPSVPSHDLFLVRLLGKWHCGYTYDRSDCTAWRSIDRTTGDVGPVVERTTESRREWVEVPEDGALVVIAYRHGVNMPLEITSSRVVKSFDKAPIDYAVAWCYASDLLTAPSGVREDA